MTLCKSCIATCFMARLSRSRATSARRLPALALAGSLAIGAAAASASALGAAATQGAAPPARTDAPAPAPKGAGGIPGRPEQLTYPPLTFEAPRAADYRRTLSDGTVVYMAPNTEFPLISLSVTCMGGANLDPADRVGLASMTGSMMRRGGAGALSASEFDETLDFMATNMSVRVGEWNSSASLDCLASNFDESLKLFVDMLRNPGFEAARLKVAMDEAMEGLKQRNDDADSIIDREWGMMFWGPDHHAGRQPTSASLAAITESDMRAMAARIFAPANMIISVTGDFEPDAMARKLEQALAGWPRGERLAPPSAPKADPVPGLYIAQKDIPQGKVYIGMRSIERDSPDAIPYFVMNDILGGGGFSSRIMQRVRSDEGLAYSAGSRFAPEPFYAGSFRAGFQSKSPTVALAIKLIMDEIGRIRTEPVSAEELEVAKASLIETFPQRFASKPAMLGVFVTDEWTNRPADFWQGYRDRVKAVTAADVQRVAQKYLKPEQMAFMVVGNWSDIAKGDPQGRADMAKLCAEYGIGAPVMLPARDPVTLVPVAAQPVAKSTPEGGAPAQPAAGGT
ncbi:MAG: insulinase family protein [Phycisphaerales bacterium]|nr:insulinase family protein [Phycisphaerales bacterium]